MNRAGPWHAFAQTVSRGEAGPRPEPLRWAAVTYCRGSARPLPSLPPAPRADGAQGQRRRYHAAPCPPRRLRTTSGVCSRMTGSTLCQRYTLTSLLLMELARLRVAEGTRKSVNLCMLVRRDRGRGSPRCT